MKQIGRHIPNILTSINLLFGGIAIVLAPVSLTAAFCAVLLGAVFDFSDGFAARGLNAYSPVGKDLDSLADMVTFGVAPSVMVFYRLRELLPVVGFSCPVVPLIPYFAFLLVVFSALRLAIFNNDERQSQNFIGLPTPANALFWCGLSAMTICSAWEQPLFWAVIALIPVFSWLLVSEIPMFSLKMKSYGWEGNEHRYFFILAALLLCGFLWYAGIMISILLYILLSVSSRKKMGKEECNDE